MCGLYNERKESSNSKIVYLKSAVLCVVMCALKNGSFYLYCTHFEFLKFECAREGSVPKVDVQRSFTVPGRAPPLPRVELTKGEYICVQLTSFCAVLSFARCGIKKTNKFGFFENNNNLMKVLLKKVIYGSCALELLINTFQWKFC